MPTTGAILQQLVDVGVRLVEARYGALGVLNGQEDALARFFTAGIGGEAHAAIGPLPEAKGLLGVLLRDHRPLRMRDLRLDPRSVGFLLDYPPMRSFLGMPILSARKVRGSLHFTEKVGAPEFRAEDERLAESLARLAADALDGEAGQAGVRRSLDYLRDAVKESAGAVVIMSPGRVIIRWSAAAAALFGFSAEEALGRGFVDLLVPPEDRTEWRSEFEPRLMRDLLGGNMRRFRSTRLHKDGRRIPVSVTLCPVLHEVAGIKTIMGIYTFRKT